MQPITLTVNGTAEPIAADDLNRSLLDYLRDRLNLRGTKEGCASGDCGACTVIVATASEAEATADLDQDQRYYAVNSCIAPAGAFLNRSIITVEGIGTPARPHPVQTAMVTENGSQCGFCTPGFVMAMVAQQLDASPFPAADSEHLAAARSISGNLCRCTGYRPILGALKIANARVNAQFNGTPSAALPAASVPAPGPGNRLTATRYLQPQTRAALEDAIAASSNPPVFVAGSTDLWLEATQRYREFDRLIDLHQVAELNQLERSAGWLRIGAAVTHRRLTRLFSGDHPLGADLHCAGALHLLDRFGSPQVRNRGTLGGNIGNGSPIADWPPFLLCLDAVLVLAAPGRERRVALADFYTGYRRTLRADDEYLLRIELPDPAPLADLQCYKISKRTDDDISAVFGAFLVRFDNEVISDCRIAFGGMAATPVRLRDVEAQLLGRRADADTEALAASLMGTTLTPIGDVRASASYRLAMAQSLLRKALQGQRDAAAETDLFALQPIATDSPPDAGGARS